MQVDPDFAHLWPRGTLDPEEIYFSTVFQWNIRKQAGRGRDDTGTIRHTEDGDDQHFELCYRRRTIMKNERQGNEVSVANIHIRCLQHARLFYAHFNTYIWMYHAKELQLLQDLDSLEHTARVRVTEAVQRYLIFYHRLNTIIISWARRHGAQHQEGSPFFAYAAYTAARIWLGACWPEKGPVADWWGNCVLEDPEMRTFGKNVMLCRELNI